MNPIAINRSVSASFKWTVSAKTPVVAQCDRLMVGWLNEWGGVPREQKLLKGHIPSPESYITKHTRIRRK